MAYWALAIVPDTFVLAGAVLGNWVPDWDPAPFVDLS